MTDFFTLLVCGIHCVHANDYFGMRMLPHMCKYPHVAACAWLALEMEKGVSDKLGYVRDGSG